MAKSKKSVISLNERKMLLDIIGELGKAENDKVNYNPEQFNDEARRKIAEFFVRWYFIILVIVFLGTLIFNIAIYSMTKDDTLFVSTKDMILLTTSAIGGSLGFIVGYYFKGSDKKI